MTTVIERAQAQVQRAEERIVTLEQAIIELQAHVAELRAIPEPDVAEAGELVGQERRLQIMRQTLLRAKQDAQAARQEQETLCAQRQQFAHVLRGFEEKIGALRPRVQESVEIADHLSETCELLIGTRFSALCNSINDMLETIRQERLELSILEGRAQGVREKMTWYDAEVIELEEQPRAVRGC